MSFKIGSALAGLSLAACLATAGTIVAPSKALAQDCSHLDTKTQAWVNCVRKKTNDIRANIKKHDEECDRGGCGPKANKIQKKVNKNSNARTFEALDADD